MPESKYSAQSVDWRMATWWQCAILLAFTALFGWIVRMGLKSTGPGVWPHVLIPPYGLWIYATLAALVNRRSVVVTPEKLVITNRPIPVRERRLIRREDVALVYFSPTMTVSDGGESIILFFTAGVETRAGAHVQVFGEFKDEESARSAAQRIVDGFGPGPDGRSLDLRVLGALRDDPGDKRIALIWVGVTVAAFVAGILWDVAYRMRP